MKTIESKDPNVELIEKLASPLGIDAEQFVRQTDILDDLGQFEADREKRNQRILEIFSGMGYEEELEITMQKAKAYRVEMALLLYSNRQAKFGGEGNGVVV